MKAYVLSDRHTDDDVCDACSAGTDTDNDRGHFYQTGTNRHAVPCARLVIATSLPTPADAPENASTIEVKLCVDCAKAIVAAAGGAA